jgi:F0F1-type ATP synthase membrane subunit b/b'
MSGLLFHTINLIILLTIIFLAARKKIRTAFQQQHDDFQKKLKAANQEFEATQAAYLELKTEFDQLSQRLDEMRQTSMREIENESQRIDSEAERQIEHMIQEGESRIRIEGEKARAQLESELLDSALVTARTIVAQEVATKESEWMQGILGPNSSVKEGRKNYAS